MNYTVGGRIIDGLTNAPLGGVAITESGIQLGQSDGSGAYSLELSNGTHLLVRSEEHTSELQSQFHLVCRLLLEKKKNKKRHNLMAPCNPHILDLHFTSSCTDRIDTLSHTSATTQRLRNVPSHANTCECSHF